MAEASRAEDYRVALRGLTDSQLRTYLRENSGLPGPRANLTLADVFATQAAPEQVLALSAESDEYLAFCGTEGLGPLALDPHLRPVAMAALLNAAVDDRWRIREAAARALQLLGDEDADLLHEIIDGWSRSRDLLVQRAAIAAICEPRLLASPMARAQALTACERATTRLLEQGASAEPEARRILRTALGYCWSVAIAADPDAGLPAFTELAADGSPDAQWIVSSNLGKARLKRVLQARHLTFAAPARTRRAARAPRDPARPRQDGYGDT